MFESKFDLPADSVQFQHFLSASSLLLAVVNTMMNATNLRASSLTCFCFFRACWRIFSCARIEATAPLHIAHNRPG